MDNQNYAYIFQRNRTYYFSRRIPSDMRELYSSYRVVKSLRTKSRKLAQLASNQINFQLESYWNSIRVELITKNIVHHTLHTSEPSFVGCGYKLLDVKDHYLKLKGSNKDRKFHNMVNRNITYLIDAIGDKDLSDFTSSDGAKFRDYLSNRRLSLSSIKRIFASLRPMINLMIEEQGLNVRNPLANTFMLSEEVKVKRLPIPLSVIQNIQSLCLVINDDIRWIVAMISDTGMRLSEACGLMFTDVRLDCEIPHIMIKSNMCRSLKTRSSERIIPLVGLSLWAAKQAIQVPYREGREFLFPRYIKDNKCNSNSASAALNKWLKAHVDEGCVIHSFRHSLRDRLRAVECPSDIVDQIGGWSRSSVGQSYGEGYPLKVLHKWLQRIT